MTYDVRLFARHRDSGELYRVVQDEDGRIAYEKAEESELRKADLVAEITGFMVGIANGRVGEPR